MSANKFKISLFIILIAISLIALGFYYNNHLSEIRKENS
jgi:uncharacterized membrane protein YidH (DUF202 family)